MRKLSKVAPEWWDYTTLDDEILSDAARLTVTDLQQLSRNGFTVEIHDTLEDFYLAEALEYIGRATGWMWLDLPKAPGSNMTTIVKRPITIETF